MELPRLVVTGWAAARVMTKSVKRWPVAFCLCPGGAAIDMKTGGVKSRLAGGNPMDSSHVRILERSFQPGEQLLVASECYFGMLLSWGLR